MLSSLNLHSVILNIWLSHDQKRLSLMQSQLIILNYSHTNIQIGIAKWYSCAEIFGQKKIVLENAKVLGGNDVIDNYVAGSYWQLCCWEATQHCVLKKRMTQEVTNFTPGNTDVNDHMKKIQNVIVTAASVAIYIHVPPPPPPQRTPYDAQVIRINPEFK